MRTLTATLLLFPMVLGLAAGQSPASYRRIEGWAPAPGGTTWGQVPGMAIDDNGRLFVFRRGDPPIVELDADGRVLKAWGEQAFVWPHGIRVDRDGFLWITDGRHRDGKGQQVFKYRRDGTLLMTLGTAGVAENHRPPSTARATSQSRRTATSSWRMAIGTRAS